MALETRTLKSDQNSTTGRCQLMGRVEDVCNCPSATHFNYNSDQLLKTFHLVGSPTDEVLKSEPELKIPNPGHAFLHQSQQQKQTSHLSGI